MNCLKRGWKAVARSPAGEYNISRCINILNNVENFAIFRLYFFFFIISLVFRNSYILLLFFIRNKKCSRVYLVYLTRFYLFRARRISEIIPRTVNITISLSIPSEPDRMADKSGCQNTNIGEVWDSQPKWTGYWIKTTLYIGIWRLIMFWTCFGNLKSFRETWIPESVCHNWSLSWWCLKVRTWDFLHH